MPTFLEKVKAYFKGDEKELKKFLEAAEALKSEQKFMDYKLADGTAIKVEPELAQGSMVVLADGTPAPDGEHMVEGGVKIKVLNGVIEAIEKEEMKTDVAAMEAQFKAIKDEMAAIKAENETLKNTVAGFKFASVADVENLKKVVSGVVDALDLDEKGKQQFKKQTPGPSNDTNKPLEPWEKKAERYRQGFE